MKVIIAGSRLITDFNDVKNAIDETVTHGICITEVVSGGARGVDSLGEQFANMFHLPIKKFPADWNMHGRRAGFLRNEQMANYADCLIAIWDGNSRGTGHMINIMTKLDKPVFKYIVEIKS